MGKIKDYLARKAIKFLSSSSDFGIALANWGWSGYAGGSNGQEQIGEKSQLAISSNFNAMNGISSDVAKLPVKMIEYGTNKDGLSTRTDVRSDPIAKLLNRQFNPRMSAYIGKQTIIRWAISIGNGYAEVVRNGSDAPTELHPIHPSRVPPELAREKRDCSQEMIAAARAWNADPYSLILSVNCKNGSRRLISERDLLWLKGPSNDGYFGMPSVAIMQNSLGLDSAVMRFLKHFYQNSARPAMILTTEEVLRKEQRNELKQEWTEAYEGPGNAGKTVVLDAGLKVASFQQSFEAMELNDLRKSSRTDIAGFYRYPLTKLMVEGIAQGWDATHAQESSYINDCLLGHITPFEEEVRRQLMGEYDSFAGYHDNFDIHFETKGRMRGDDKSRAAYLQFRFNTASITPNEIREVEDENPLDDPSMNKVFIQGAMLPLELAGAQVLQSQQQNSQSEPDSEDTKNLIKIGQALRIEKRLTNGAH